MVTVYGADWCEDTRRSLRHLRRLAVSHVYVNIDEDLSGLERAQALNAGERRTPTIDLGTGGPALVEPDNDTLTGALVELEMLTQTDVHDRLGVQNVGDFERVLRTTAGAVLFVAGGGAPKGVRWPFQVLGSMLALSGLSGWCPVYHGARVTSLDGPGDRPDEAHRKEWLTARSREPQPAAEAPGAAR